MSDFWQWKWSGLRHFCSPFGRPVPVMIPAMCYGMRGWEVGPYEATVPRTQVYQLCVKIDEIFLIKGKCILCKVIWSPLWQNWIQNITAP
jgi:hypothetical protein